MSTKETKPSHLAGDGYITLKVRGQDENEVFFRIKRSAKLKEVMDGYCVRQCLDIDTVVFLFEERRLRDDETPDKREMEDGDQIDALLHQDGVCGFVI